MAAHVYNAFMQVYTYIVWHYVICPGDNTWKKNAYSRIPINNGIVNIISSLFPSKSLSIQYKMIASLQGLLAILFATSAGAMRGKYLCLYHLLSIYEG